MNQSRGGVSWFAAAAVPCCTGPVAYRDRRPLETDLQNLAAACAAAQPGRSLYECRIARRADEIRPGHLLQERRRLCRSARRGAAEEYEAIAGPASFCRSTRPISARRGTTNTSICRRRIPAHRRAQHRRAQPRDAQHPARVDAHAHLLGQLRGAAHARHPARQSARYLHAGAAAGALYSRRPIRATRMNGRI